MNKYLTRKSPGVVVDEDWQSQRDHWSSPDGCHEDCPACLDEATHAPFTTPDGRGGEVWQLALGEQCNAMMTLATKLQVQGYPFLGEGYQHTAATLRRLVERVANFESLHLEPPRKS